MPPSQVYRGGITDCCRLSKRAVDRICLGVGNECFGLLGVNGECIYMYTVLVKVSSSVGPSYLIVCRGW